MLNPMAERPGSETHAAVERRRTDRAPVVVRIEYSTVDALFSDFTRNINEGGIFVETEEPVPLDQKVDLKLRLPGSSELVRVQGRVVRAETVNQGGRRVHEIRILGDDGRVRTVRVDAETGAVL
jgi:uncharacterized protein (TIGR02266 family)